MQDDTSDRGGLRAPLVAIVAFALASLVADRAGIPPEPRAIDADPAVFSAGRARASLARILGDEASHPVGSDAHADVVGRLLAELRAIGLEPTVQDALVVGRNGVVTHVRNVVATIAGKKPGAAIALAAHHDSVAAGPGASDDGAGVAAIVECARAIRAGAPLEHALVLLVTDGEEVDLSGACAFVREHPLARDVRAVVNLEARGTDGLAYLFQTGPGVGDAIARFGDLARQPSTSSIAALVYDKLPNDTDLTVFLRAGWTGLNFAYIGGVRRYHTPRDDLAHLDVRSLQHLGEGALAGVRALDAQDLAIDHDAGPERVWHDVLGRFVVGWPRAWSVPLAVVALAGLVVAARKHARSRTSAGGMRVGACGELARGALVAAIGIASAALLVWAFARAQLAVHESADPWFAATASWSAGGLALGMLGAALACTLPFARRASAEHVFLGAWILCAIAGLLAAILEPAACLLFVAPALVAAIAAQFVGRSASASGDGRVDARFLAVVLVPFFALASIWLPFEAGVEAALGFALGFVPGALAGAVASALAPLLLARPRRTTTALAAVALLAFVALALAPDRTADAPIATNTAHVQTADAASWSIATYGAPLPGGAREAVTGNARLLPWARWLPTAAVAPAPRHGDPAPRAEVERLGPDDARRSRVRIVSPRGATTLVLGFPAGAIEVVAIRSGGLEVRGDLPSSPPLTFVGIGPEGGEVDYVRKDEARWSFDLADARPGLPAGLAPPFAAESTRVPRGRGDVSIVATSFVAP